MKPDRAPVFPFHYGTEADQYSFYRVPKVLFTEPVFSGLSTDAKILYGLLLDRMQLSIRNRWVDEHGRVFIYFTIGSVMEALACGNKKAVKLMAELDEKNGIGLISRIRQGLGKPDKIFVHKCVIPEVSYEHVQKCQNNTSASVKKTVPEVSKRHANDTEYNDIDMSENEPIYQGDVVENDVMRYEEYLSYFKDSLSFEYLLMDYPYNQDQLHEILELLVETVCSGKQTIRISGEDRPIQLVKSRFMKLNGEHIRYVLECMKENTTRVRNIRQYLLAALYNAPVTISNYYSSLVNYDMYGGNG